MKFYAILLMSALSFWGLSSCDDDNDSDGGGSNTKTTFTATLNGAGERPAVETAATGSATLVYDSATKKFTITVTHNVVDANAGHIHKGDAETVLGAIVFPFASVTSPITYNSDVLNEQEISDLFANLNYVNIHSPLHPTGEIRGQLIKQGTVGY